MDAYPSYIGIITEKHVQQYAFPAEAYNDYREKLLSSPLVGSALTAGRRYPNYVDISEEDVALILDSTDVFLKELLKTHRSSD